MSNRPHVPARPRLRDGKAPLSRDAVVSAARDCLREEGPAGLTMRKVAARLETGPASLYVYVSNLRELQVAVIDSIAAEVGRPTGRQGENRPVVELLLEFGRRLESCPGAAGLALETQPTGPAFLDMLETMMELLVADGLSVPKAVRVGDAMVMLTTALVAERDARQADGPGQSSPELFDDALAGDAESRPLLLAGHHALVGEPGELRFAWTLRALLAGAVASSEDLGGLQQSAGEDRAPQ